MTNESNLIKRCHVNTNTEGDTFVGIKSVDGNIAICFPLGYSLPNNDKQVKKDIINLITVLTKFSDKKNKLLPQQSLHNPKEVNFPIQAYMIIINQYINSGYYIERDKHYKESTRGKINWSRTIKTQKPLPQFSSFIYLKFVANETVSNNDNLITLIHEYCVYESFQKLGWLYTSSMPSKPRICFDKNMFLSILYSKLGKTFDEKNKTLFNSMIAIINYLGEQVDASQLYYGTNRFEYVWEKLVDFTFGVDSKEEYFPKTVWHLEKGRNKNNAALEPDTVMIIGDRIFVLDAKYYKYGVTNIPAHLPESTSINKQITYGEYIATEDKFKQQFGENYKVYNAFLMPFDKQKGISRSSLKYIGEATGNWKNCNKEYEHVQGILIDVRDLMYNFVRRNEEEILRLSILIEESVQNSIYNLNLEN